MTYPGGKGGSGVYQTLINQIPPHDVYCAPFLGRDAILRHKYYAARSIGVDLDETALEWWEDRGIPGLELFQCDGIEWMRHQFGQHGFLRSHDDKHGDSREPINGAARPGYPSGCDASSPVARSSGFAGGDADSCVPVPTAVADKCGAASRWFIYVDPPYPFATRRSGRMYRHEMTDDQHEQLLATLVRLPVPTMVSSYPNQLYDDWLAGWRTLYFCAVDRRGNKRREQLWMNYGKPTALHDYRFVGKDKRQREKVRRRSRNWVEGLQAIQDEFGTGPLYSSAKYSPHDYATVPGVS